MNFVSKLQKIVRRIKYDVMTVYIIARDPRTPILIRLLALIIAAYALSPIDLIPDFIPVVGYLDDLILLPMGILLVIKLTPKNIIEASRERAAQLADKPSSTIAAIVIVVIWVACAAGVGYWLYTV